MKQTLLLACVLSLCGLSLSAQSLSIDKVCTLDAQLKESSGLLLNDAGVWTHNDSGNEPMLYLLDTTDGSIRHSIRISNATNVDWEAVCSDGNSVFIGDFGNNNGDRTDLRIFKLSAAEISMETDSLTADTIAFYYPNQNQFEWDNYSTNFDCEAMIAFGDSLYLFSKNWGNEKTYLYSLPKTAGNHPAQLLDSMDAGGLVTDAAVDATTNNLVLLGYSRYMTSAFVYHLYHYFDASFFSGERQKYNLNRIFHQLEGIAFENNGLLMSSEDFQTKDAGLFRAAFDANAGVEGNITGSPCFYPNPANGQLQMLNCEAFSHFIIRDIYGRELLRSRITRSRATYSIGCLQAGTYILEFHHRNTDETFTDLLIVE